MRGKIIAITVALILVMSMVLLAAAAPIGPQTWYLNCDPYLLGSGSSVMQKTFVPDPDCDREQVFAGSQYDWLSENPADGDVTFPEGNWVIKLEVHDDWSSDLEVQVGGYDLNTDFYPFSTTVLSPPSYSGGGSDGIITVILQMEASGTVFEGDYLALRVMNHDVFHNKVWTRGVSRLESPSSDPGFPMPELAAGILLFAGLIGLGSYVVVRRRKAKTGVNV